MKKFVCPMHPEIGTEISGSCPKCGMDLVLKENASAPNLRREDANGLSKITWKSYLPLTVIISLILLVTMTLALRDLQLGIFSVYKPISYFMEGFFLVFAGFKLMDLKGFVEGYATYDLLATKWLGYGYLYPFIELGFGLAMILVPQSRMLLLLEFIVMVFSGIGVAIKLAKKESFQCACLGTFLKVPLTKVTLIEDFGMAGLALLMLIIP